METVKSGKVANNFPQFWLKYWPNPAKYESDTAPPGGRCTPWFSRIHPEILGISSPEGTGIDLRTVDVMAKLPHRRHTTVVRSANSSTLANEAQIGHLVGAVFMPSLCSRPNYEERCF